MIRSLIVLGSFAYLGLFHPLDTELQYDPIQAKA